MRTQYRLAAFAALAALVIALCHPAQAQQYRNVVNTRFNTVSNGPMQALIVDVPDIRDRRTVDAAIAAQVNAARKNRERGLLRELDTIRRTFRWKGPLNPGIPDIVMVREKGRLILPESRAVSRGGGDILFNFPISAAANDGGWTNAQAAELANIRDKVYPVLKTVYGDPSWSGTVTVVNGDNQASILSDPNALSGGVYDAANSRIIFAQYNSTQTKVLNLTQMMAIAFHGPNMISYDAWERGMARAATLSVAFQLKNDLGVSPDDPLWHALDRYDIMNQPPLGNDRFFPVSKVNGEANTATFPLMLVPRLMMSGSAWLKAETESSGFLKRFNEAYYPAVATNAAIKNNVPALKDIAAAALSTVEGVPFKQWYEQQYVLDTSVTPGVKLYAWLVASRGTTGDPDPAFGIILHYYRTFYDSNGRGDEQNLNGTGYPIYWDFLYSTRLFLAAQYERVDIREGTGTVSPVFPNTITPPGGDASLQGRQRVTIDFPVNGENVRLYLAPRDMGTEAAPNNFWGVVVGASTGSLNIKADAPAAFETTVQVKQGSWGVNVPAPAFTRPTTATLTFTSADNQVTQRKVNIGYDEYISVLYASDPVQSLTHTFPGGPAMISFPIRPLNPLAELALLNPANDQPLFNASNLLLAQWRQTLQTTDGDKYLRYPTLEPLTPGKGYWENFSAATAIKIKGRVTTLDQNVSTGLTAGWKQIGSPYQQPVNISDLRFQYLAENTGVSLATAISKGWVVATNVPSVGQVAIFDYDPAQGYIPATTLAPWKGYWIRVLVSEGLTITYPNPTPQGRAATVASRAAAVPTAVSGWSLPLVLRGPDGRGATVWLGQSSDAESGANLKMNALRPPDFSRAVPSAAFPKPALGNDSGDYITDIKRPGAAEPWDITVYTPEPANTYTLTWEGLNRVPRNTRLVLVDKATGQRQYLNSSSGYSFVPGTSPTRSFQIVAESRTRNQLRIFNVLARPTRASGAVEISYELSQGATVTAEIRDSRGQVVRRLNPGRAAASGVNSAVWDSRDDKAMSVAAGIYLIQISARTPEGESTRVVTPFTIVR